MKRHSAVVACLFVTSCASAPPARQRAAAPTNELVLVSRAVREGIPSEPSTGAEIIEMRIHGETATISRRYEELGPHRWSSGISFKADGTARRSSDGWIFNFHWHDGRTSSSARLSCVPVHKRVHFVGAQPVGLCTAERQRTAGEQATPGWWCEEEGHNIEPRRRVAVRDPDARTALRDPDARFILLAGEFFASAPGVEHVSQTCCPAGSDACDGSDGGWRSVD